MAADDGQNLDGPKGGRELDGLHARPVPIRQRPHPMTPQPPGEQPRSEIAEQLARMETELHQVRNGMTIVLAAIVLGKVNVDDPDTAKALADLGLNIQVSQIVRPGAGPSMP